MSKTFILETKRLILRELNESDTLPLFEILSDSETMKYYPAPCDFKGAESWVNRSIKSYAQYGFGLWAILMKDGENFAGQCGITYTSIDDVNVPEIGYHVNKKFWNKGIATESAYAAMNYGFKNFNLNEIFIHTWVNNIPSRRIAEKIGMLKIKEYDKHIPEHNTTRKHIVYSKKSKANQLNSA